MAAICTVVNKYHSQFDIDIQRGTKYGNYVGVGCQTREEAVRLFTSDFLAKVRSGEVTRQELEELRGKRLGCTCHPKVCHGDIIAYVVNNLDRFYGEI